MSKNGAPSLYNATKLILGPNDTSAYIDGRWVPARPLGFHGLVLSHRLRLAWGVFTGRYDALKWEGQP